MPVPTKHILPKMTDFVNIQPAFDSLCTHFIATSDRLRLFWQQANKDFAQGTLVMQTDDGSLCWPRDQIYRVLCELLSGVMVSSIREYCERQKYPCPRKPIEGALSVAISLDNDSLNSTDESEAERLQTLAYDWYFRSQQTALTSHERCVAAAGLLRTSRNRRIKEFRGDGLQQFSFSLLEFAIYFYINWPSTWLSQSNDGDEYAWQRKSAADFLCELAHLLANGHFPLVGYRLTARSLLERLLRVHPEHWQAIELCIKHIDELKQH